MSRSRGLGMCYWRIYAFLIETEAALDLVEKVPYLDSHREDDSEGGAQAGLTVVTVGRDESRTSLMTRFVGLGSKSFIT